ncbi:MAG: polymerase sigma factor RpoH [Labilithrix sp.]|nr:polymerase sigma factor RpoH [Labilithrix sp.]
MALFEQWHTHGSGPARAEIIESSLWLVAVIAREYRCSTSDRADLIAEGYVALLIAFARFDRTRGVRFATYARFWVSAAMNAYLGRAENALGSLARARMNAKRRREASLVRSPADSGHVGGAWDACDVSLDAPLGGDVSTTLLDRLAADALDAETVMESSRRSAAVNAAVERARSTFDSRERVIFDVRFVSDEDDEGSSLNEVARKLQLSRERVRQLEERVRRKLADHLRLALAEAAPDADPIPSATQRASRNAG